MQDLLSYARANTWYSNRNPGVLSLYRTPNAALLSGYAFSATNNHVLPSSVLDVTRILSTATLQVNNTDVTVMSAEWDTWVASDTQAQAEAIAAQVTAAGGT